MCVSFNHFKSLIVNLTLFMVIALSSQITYLSSQSILFIRKEILSSFLKIIRNFSRKNSLWIVVTSYYA